MTTAGSPADGFGDFGHSLANEGLSDRTLKAYHRDLTDFRAWVEDRSGEGFDPSAVEGRDIRDYRTALLERGAEPATINRRLVALRRYFEWLRGEGAITFSPFEMLRRLRVKDQGADTGSGIRWLDDQEQAAVRRAVRKTEDPRDIAIIELLLGAGLRISELAALEYGDLTLKERGGEVRVRAAVGKGAKARSVPLDARTRQALRAYLDVRQPAVPRDPVFLGQRGPVTVKAVDYVVRKIGYMARVEGLTAHDLRHTFGKNMVNAGVPLDQVAALMGHSSLDTTKVYTRPSRQDLERAVRKGAGEVD
jgi:integrase/recombinase XerC